MAPRVAGCPEPRVAGFAGSATWATGALAAFVLTFAGCGPSDTSPPSIALDTTANGKPPSVEVRGLSRATLNALESANLTADEWARVFRVAVAADAPAMLGEYMVSDGIVRFTPLFPLDRGRRYDVTFDLSRVPGGLPAEAPGPLVEAVSLPASTAAPSTVVARVFPTGDRVPENMLRMYIEFSAPMGRVSGVEHIALLDHTGREIEGAVLPLDYEFWSPDHTRFTVFFDPGRVKKGILPNREMGRPLEIGTTVTLVVSRDWRDAQGLPLREDFRRVFNVGPADEQPLDTSRWRIQPPKAGGRDGLVVTFPEPLDHGLLMRALGVRRNGQPVPGDAAVSPGETGWSFTPSEPWQPGAYDLLALDILEDLAGNQIGRAFEVDNFDTVDKSPNPQTLTLPFRIGPLGE